MYTPYIVEGQERHDLFARMLKDRVVFLNSAINDEVAGSIVAQLLYLDSVGDDEITLYIASPGGHISSGLSIIDTMNFIKSDVSTVAVGSCASMGALILGAGVKGKRRALPHSSVMIHQPLISGGLGGSATDLTIAVKNLNYYKDLLIEMLTDQTGQPREKIIQDIERDFYMTAQEAVSYGIVDKIIASKKITAPKSTVQDF